MNLRHFSRDEFICECCGAEHMDDGFLIRLDELRHVLGFPFVITSGWRCPDYNKQIRGAKASKHLEGIAADVACSSFRAYKIVETATRYNFNGIGVSQKGRSRFVHLDTREGPGLIWTY